MPGVPVLRRQREEDFKGQGQPGRGVMASLGYISRNVIIYISFVCVEGCGARGFVLFFLAIRNFELGASCLLGRYCSKIKEKIILPFM
jgi:hypothetical protein